MQKYKLAMTFISSIAAFMSIFRIVMQNNTTYVYLDTTYVYLDHSKTPSYDQFEFCYIKNKNQSDYGASYSFDNDGMDMLKFIQSIKIDKTISVFVFTNNIRQPNLNHSLCTLPFIEFKINDSNYLIDNIPYGRNDVNKNVLKQHANDTMFFLNWLHNIYLTYNSTHNLNQWILYFEDDILLCPFTIKYILNIINPANKYKYQNINIMFLGYGATAVLLRASFIQTYYVLLDDFVAEGAYHKGLGIDLYVLAQAKDYNHYHIAASNINLVFHPSSQTSKSVSEHSYKTDLKCHQKRRWKFATQLPYIQNDEIMTSLKANDKSKYCDIISVFSSYCNQFTLYWFHRLLYTQIFLSTKIPKVTFILIHNIKGEECVDDNNKIYLYQIFTKFIEKYFNYNIKINIYFYDQLFSASQQRNVLIDKMNEYFLNSSNIDYKKHILQKYNNIIVSWFDGDDISHPRRFEFIDAIYSNKQINGSLIHKCLPVNCRNPHQFDENVLMSMNAFLLKHNFSKHDYQVFDDNLFQQMYDFHTVQFNELQSIYKFQNIDIEMDKIYNVMQNKLTRDILMNDYGNKPNLNATNFALDYWPEVDIKNKKYSTGGYYANGWMTCTLSLLNNKFDTNMRTDEGYDYYLFPVKLGIYCNGDI